MKFLITDFRKQTLYGDMHLTETGWYFPFRGQRIQVKLIGIFWITYVYYTI